MVGWRWVGWGTAYVEVKWVTFGDSRVPTYGYTFGEMSLELGLISYHHPYNWGPNRVFPAILLKRYLIGVIDTGCFCGVMRLPPGDCCDGWLGMGDDKMLGLHGDKFLRHGACLVLSSPLEMGGFWRSPAVHLRQILVQYPGV